MKGDTVAQIKDRLSIEAVVRPYVLLTRRGRSLIGLCPFHKEKTPSFHVSSERGSYHCFGCGESGDIFSFVQKVEGVDFKEALKQLAEKAGVPLEYSADLSALKERQDRLRLAMQKASAWYASNLPRSAAHTYALSRKLTEETIKDWGLGYAPDSWRALLEALSGEGFSVSELVAAGLVKEADGKPGTYYDRFRNRLIFPIHDSVGRVVAFTGRALSSDDPAKYLNSPETELYHKSELLFGLDRAKEAIRTRRYALLVEGQMDVLHAHQAGFKNAVALSGTALSSRHVALLKRYSENLMLTLDADAAGLGATAKAATLALLEGLKVKAVQLPQGKDPADLLSDDPKAFATYLQSAKPIVDFFLSVLSAQEHDPHRLLSLAERIVLPLIRAVPSPMEKEHFVQAAARTLGLSTESVRESLARLPQVAAAVRTSEAVPAHKRVDAHQHRAEQLLAVLHVYKETALAQRVKAEYLRITEASSLPEEIPSESVLFETEAVFGEAPDEHAADDLLRAFEETLVRRAYQEAVQQLRRAEADGSPAHVQLASALCQKIAARLANLTH